MKYSYLPYNKSLKAKAREMRNNPTAAENKLWQEYFRKNKYSWLRQKPIDNYIVDFYCPKLSLAIEIDGGSHLDKESILYDNQRTKILEKYGLKILRFYNDDVLSGAYIIGEIIDREISKIK